LLYTTSGILQPINAGNDLVTGLYHQTITNAAISPIAVDFNLRS